ncbi:hypothetical protein LPJ66_001764 [Kickxella alabastrina]|uniref:Uncharacterized protein n=1 Tax=Kickxella alabastrina TaxID=61397 RepID=A0ACC1ISA2_9FUNG|nr:hypothetical protein LPJ66_001764 [Kickxella alabastrina]
MQSGSAEHEQRMRLSMSLSMNSRTAAGTRSVHRSSPNAPGRSRENGGLFPQHPSRGHSDTSMSVIIPDMPSPLSSAPSALAFKHDRRRDFFTDNSTFVAATGRQSSENAGIHYDIRERSTAEPTDAPLRSTSHTKSPTVIQIATSGSELPRTSRTNSRKNKSTSKSKSSDSSLPLFRRAGSENATHGAHRSGYGPSSRLPRFILDRLHNSESGNTPAASSADSLAADSSRASVFSGNSAAMGSPKSATSASAMQAMLELEEAKLLSAERKGQLRAIDSVLSEEQKIAYVGLVYVLLVDIQDRLNVQFKESQSSTASFMNFSRRLMLKMYSHIQLNADEQRMVELLPRHKITAADMALSLAAQGDTILVEADQDLAVMHSQTDEELVQALRGSFECRSSFESERQSKSPWQMMRWDQKDEDVELYSQYAMLPTESFDPESKVPAACEPAFAPTVVGDGLRTDTDRQQVSGVELNACSAGRRSHGSTCSRPSSSNGGLESELAKDADFDQAFAPDFTKFGHAETNAAITTGTDANTDALSVLDDVTLTKVDADQQLAIDVRATLILDMFLLLLSDEVYDSRGRYLLRRLAEALKYPWAEVMRCERRVTHQLSLHDYAVDVTASTKGTTEIAIKERADKGKTRRMVIIGLATVGGGLVIGLSAGLLAPAIGAGIGATLGAIGVANTGAFFGSIGGTALITGAATLTGSSLAGRQITRRTRFAEQFEFIPCIDEKQTNLVLTVPGWLGKADNGVFAFSTLDPLNGDHFSLLWESEALRRLGSSLRMIVGEVFSITLTQTLQHTVLPSLLGPLSIPMWLAKLGYVLDNPWSSGCELATNAGPVVADLLLQRVQGQRPVTLIGYSIGARLIFYMLLELAKMNAYGLVEDVYLFGAPIIASEEDWRTAASVVGGRFVNAYSTKDWILGFFYRTTSLGRMSIAGMHPIYGVNGLENIDVSDEVPGHNAYREVIPILLKGMGVPVTSTTLHDPNEKPGDSEDDRAMINELEKAAEMLEEHEKKKKKVWARRWSFWDSGSTVRGGDPASASSASPTSSLTGNNSATAAQGEVDAAARELAELGIQVKEMPSTLPALVVVRDPSPAVGSGSSGNSNGNGLPAHSYA